MKQQIEILKKIQELSLTRAECVARGDTVHADTLTQEIEVLAAKLDPRMRALYTRLSAAKPLFMAAMHNGNCSGCGMMVPVAAAKMVRLSEHPVTCATCGRLLYDNVGAVASSREKAEATAEEVSKEKGLSRFSCEALMIPNLTAKTPQEAIGILAQALASNGYVTNGDELARLALEREALLSTRMGDGTARAWRGGRFARLCAGHFEEGDRLGRYGGARQFRGAVRDPQCGFCVLSEADDRPHGRVPAKGEPSGAAGGG